MCQLWSKCFINIISSILEKDIIIPIYRDITTRLEFKYSSFWFSAFKLSHSEG